MQMSFRKKWLSPNCVACMTISNGGAVETPSHFEMNDQTSLKIYI